MILKKTTAARNETTADAFVSAKVGRVAPRAPLWSCTDGARGATRPTNLNRAKVVLICYIT